MQPVSILSDIEDIDARFIAAVAKIAGASDVLLLETWNGVDPATLEMTDDDREAAIYIERYRRLGRYGLDISIFGKHRIEPNASEAEFARRLAGELGRTIVTSDCDANPWSWFRFDADGAIYQVYTIPDDAEGIARFDLACDLAPDHPDYLAANLIIGANDTLPQKPADAPDHMPRALQTFCHQADDQKLCATFWAPCPKLTRRR